VLDASKNSVSKVHIDAGADESRARTDCRLQYGRNSQIPKRS
jgi:hypothetical protein